MVISFQVSVKIAVDVADWYYKTGRATAYPVPKNLESYIREQLYETTYTSYVPNTWRWPKEHMEPRNYDQVIYNAARKQFTEKPKTPK